MQTVPTSRRGLCVAIAASLAAFAALPLTLRAAGQGPPIAPAFFGGASPSARPDLTGVILGPDAKPVRGANVYLYTAAPIKGTSPFCPSCYPDCQKHVVSDEAGRFRIPSLDPNLRFRVLVVADGFIPTFPPSVVPVRGPVRFVLPPPRPKTADLRRVFRGKIIDTEGHPVVGARVEPNGKKVAGLLYLGTVGGVDPLAVTNHQGEFELSCDRPDSQISLLLAARSLASQTTPLLPTGKKRHVFKMETGATVRGVVKGINNGPLHSVVVGITQVHKSVETFVGHIDIGTDKNGQFFLTNVTPNQDYVVYGTMETFENAAQGGDEPVFLPVQTIHIGASGSTTDLGTLSVRPARRLSGRVVLPGNAPLPPQTRLLINRDAAWDSLLVVLDKNGAFDINGLPAETVSLYLNLPGLHIAPSTKGYEKNQQTVLVSAEKGDTNGLQILMEPDKKK